MANIMTIRVPEELQIDLKKIAAKRGLTRNALVLQILWDWRHAAANTETENYDKVLQNAAHTLSADR